MKVDVNGFALHCLVEGPEGAPWVTLANSLVCSLHMWDEQAKRLARHYRVLRYDMRGHGKSDAPPSPYTIEALADDVLAVWDHFGVTRSHWIGLSLGGMVGISLALRHPARLASLVACDCRAESPPAYAAVFDERIRVTREQGMEAMVAPTLGRFFTETFAAARPDMIETFGDMIRETSAEGHIGCCEAIRGLAYEARLPEITVPTLFIGGEHDIGAPPAVMRAMHAAVPGSQYRMLEGAGHISNVHVPDAFQQAIEAFMAAAKATA